MRQGTRGAALIAIAAVIGCTGGGNGGTAGGGGEPSVGVGGQGGGGGEPSVGVGGQGGGGGEPSAGVSGQGGGGGEPSVAVGGQGGGGGEPSVAVGGEGGGGGEPSEGAGGQGGGGGEPSVGVGGQGGDGGDSGAGGATICAPGSVRSCYAGPPGTEAVGLCKAGGQTCLPDGSGYGPCTGEITPSAEDCTTSADEDCDGVGTCPSLPLWAAALGGDGTDAAAAITADAAGNLYVTGSFEGTVDFGAGPLVSAGGKDVFLLKLDPEGHVLWSRRFGAIYTEEGSAIALDAAGNIVLGGSYRGTSSLDGPPVVDFGGGPLPWNDLSDGAAFVVKLDPNGEHLWSLGDLGGSLRSPRVREVAADAAGNAVALVASVSIDNTTVSLRKYGPAGDLLWARALPSTYDSRGGLAVDSAGNILTAAEHVEGAGSCPCAYSFRVEKRDPAGDLLWQKGVDRVLFDDAGGGATDVAVDPEDNVLVAGYSRGELDLGSGPIAPGTDFVLKLSPSGDPLWQRAAPRRVEVVAADAAGHVVALGLDSLVRLDPAGVELSRLGVSGGKAVTTFLDGRIAIAGAFTGTADFGAGPLTAAGQDGFVATFDP